MNKLLIVFIFVLTLGGCNQSNKTDVEYQYTLNNGQDTVEINTDWVDAGAVMYFDEEEIVIYTSNAPDISSLGLYKMEYSYTYQEEVYTITRYVIVVDEKAPELTLNPGIDTVYRDAVWEDAGVIVVDDSLEVLTYTTEGNVDTSEVGRYVVTYTVEDSSGNESSVDRIVNVVD